MRERERERERENIYCNITSFSSTPEKPVNPPVKDTSS